MSSTELWYQLPPDMNAWNTAVLDNVSQRLPTITDYISNIVWSKLDPASGNGDGVIQLLNGLCAAPIIIRGNKLAPIDIIASNYGADPKFYPLSDNFLQKIYADNVVGQPVEKGAQTDEDYLGPSVRIKHIRTVDATKYASYDAAKHMLGEIVKSASVSDWILKNMPEVITALNTRIEDLEKSASENIDYDLPELMLLWKEGNNYYANGNLVNADLVADFCKIASVSQQERSNLMHGIPIVRDVRQKIASVRIPSEQEILALHIDTDDLFSDDSSGPNKKDIDSSPISLTTAYLKDGTSRRGLIFTPDALNYDISMSHESETFRVKNPQEYIPEIKPEDKNILGKRELFICTEGYGFGESIKTDARIGISLDMVKNMSTPNNVVVGAVGIFIPNDGIGKIELGRIEDVYTTNNKKHVRIYDLINHRLATVYISKFDMDFYEVTNEIINLANSYERVHYVSNNGVNGILTLNSDGRLVLDGDSYTIVNCPYALMNKYAMCYEDSANICKIASTYGKCEFETYFKTAAPTQEEEDRTKSQNKDTKAGTDDESAQQPQQQQLTQQTPEQTLNTDANALFGSPGAGHATDPVPNSFGGGTSVPISSKDLENVVNINSPKVMDAYVMAGLAQDGSIGTQENLMRTSDAIVTALEYLSKLLFLARQGAMDFVSEGDIQSAIQKLGDVANSIGMQTSRIGQ